MNEMWSGVITIATAIVGVAILAVLVSNRANTAQVIGAATGGFAQDLAAAEAPVTGGGGLGSNNILGGMSLSGGAGSVYAI